MNEKSSPTDNLPKNPDERIAEIFGHLTALEACVGALMRAYPDKQVLETRVQELRNICERVVQQAPAFSDALRRHMQTGMTTAFSAMLNAMKPGE
jgi:hypothetical protein